MVDKKISDITWKIFENHRISDEEHRILVDAIKTGDKQTKISVARALSRLKNPDDLRYILPILNMNVDSGSLTEAVAEYGSLAIEELKIMLEQSKKKKYLRANILKVFLFVSHHLQKEEIAPIFIKYMHDEYFMVRLLCIRGLEKLKLIETIPILNELLQKEKNDQVKNIGLDVLEKLKS